MKGRSTNHRVRACYAATALALALSWVGWAQEPFRLGGVPPHTTAMPNAGLVVEATVTTDLAETPADWGIELVPDRERNQVFAVPLGSSPARFYVLDPDTLLQHGGNLLPLELGPVTCAAFHVQPGRLLLGVAPPGGPPRILAIDAVSGGIVASAELPALLPDSEASSIIVDETRGTAHVTMRSPGAIVAVNLSSWEVGAPARPVMGYDCEAGAIDAAANKGAFLFVKTTPGRLFHNAAIARVDLATMVAEDQATLTVTDTRLTPRGFAHDPVQKYLYLASPGDRRVDRFEFHNLNARIHWTWVPTSAPPATITPDPSTGNIYARTTEHCLYVMAFGETGFRTLVCESSALDPFHRSGLVLMGQRLLSASAGSSLGTEVRSTNIGAQLGIEKNILLEKRGLGILPESSTDGSGDHLLMVTRDIPASALRTNLQTGTSQREILPSTFVDGAATLAHAVDAAFEDGGSRSWIGFAGTPARLVEFDYSNMAEGRTCTLSPTDGVITAVAADGEAEQVYVALAGNPPRIARIDMATMQPIAFHALDGESEDVVDLLCSPEDGVLGVAMGGPGARLLVRGLDDMTEIGSMALGGAETLIHKGVVDGVRGRAAFCVSSGTARSIVVVDLLTTSTVGSPTHIGWTALGDVPVVGLDGSRGIAYIAQASASDLRAVSLETGLDRGFVVGSGARAVATLPGAGGPAVLSDGASLPLPSVRHYATPAAIPQSVSARYVRVRNVSGSFRIVRNVCFRSGPRAGGVKLAIYSPLGVRLWTSGEIAGTGEDSLTRIPIGTINTPGGYVIQANEEVIMGWQGASGELDQFLYSPLAFRYLDVVGSYAQFPPPNLPTSAGWSPTNITAPAIAMYLEE